MPDKTPMPSDWLTPEQVAAEFNLGRPLLQELRSNGDGPTYVKTSRRTVRYFRPALLAWLDRYRVANGTGWPASPFSEVIHDATERLASLETTAKSLALLTPSGVGSDAAKALARDLGREVATLQKMSREVGGEL